MEFNLAQPTLTKRRRDQIELCPKQIHACMYAGYIFNQNPKLPEHMPELTNK